LCQALKDGRFLPKVDRDRLLHDVEWHIHISGFREQLVQSTCSALQQVHVYRYLLTVCCWDDLTRALGYQCNKFASHGSGAVMHPKSFVVSGAIYKLCVY